MNSKPSRNSFITSFAKLWKFKPQFKIEDRDKPPRQSLPISKEVEPEDAERLHRIYEFVSANIERENALLNFRITWAIVLSVGILGAESFAVSYAKDQHGNQPSVLIVVQIALILLTVVAAFFCWMSKNGVLAAQAQMADVKDAYFRYEPFLDQLGLPRPFGDVAAHKTGDYNAIIFPFVLMFMWSIFLIFQLGRLGFQIAHLPKEARLAKTFAAIQKCASFKGCDLPLMW